MQAAPEAAMAGMMRRYPQTDPGLANVLESAEKITSGSPVNEKSALRLIVLLQRAERELTSLR